MKMTRYWPSNGLNWGYFSGPEADSLGDASLAEFEVTKRNTLIGKMHQKLVGGPRRFPPCMISTPARSPRTRASMLRLHGVVGHSADPHLHSRLHALEHAGAIEQLFMSDADVGRRRLRLSTDKGSDCAISVDRAEDLRDGAVLLIDAARAIVLRIGAPSIWRLRARDAAAAMQLGWHAGNLHWRVRFDDDVLTVLLDGPLEDYRARLCAMFSASLVEEVVD
jgi:urease accessory protein